MGTGDKAAGRDGAGAAADGEEEDILGWYRDLGEFHKKFGFPKGRFQTNPDMIRWRQVMVLEEAGEVADAINQRRGAPAIIREACDVAYIAMGCLWTYDLPPRVAPQVIHLGPHPHVLLVTVARQLCRAMQTDSLRDISLCGSLQLHLAETIIRGVGQSYGLGRFWPEVHRANMDKICKEPGTRPVKQKSWRPPDIAGILAG